MQGYWPESTCSYCVLFIIDTWPWFLNVTLFIQMCADIPRHWELKELRRSRLLTINQPKIHLERYRVISNFIGCGFQTLWRPSDYLKFNSSSINLSKLSITTTIVCIILFFSVRKFLTITTFYRYYDRLNSLKFL